MKKRLLTMLLAGIVVLTMFGCGSKSPTQQSGDDSADDSAAGSGSGETITLMGNAADLAKPYMTGIIEAYEKSSGNKLDIVAIEQANFDTIATSKFATGDIPDVFMHFNNSSLSNYNVADNFMYMNDQEWVSDLTEGSKAYSQDSEGNILGLPYWESSVSGCFYNKTLFDELGLKPATSQAEFDELCQKLTDAGHTAICWPANGCNWMYQFGLDPVFADKPELLEQINSNKIKYADIPEVADMLEWLGNAAEKGWFGPSYLTDGWDDMSTIMGTGEAGMILIWDTWFYTDFDEGMDYTKEDFALMPVFMNTADKGTYEGGNLNMLMANKNSDKLETVLDFINFCATPENYNEAFKDIATVSVFNGQNTNIQSTMVTEAMDSVNEHQRTSTAEPKIIGYTQNETGSAITEMFIGNVDVKGAIDLMDEARIASATALGAEGF